MTFVHLCHECGLLACANFRFRPIADIRFHRHRTPMMRTHFLLAASLIIACVTVLPLLGGNLAIYFAPALLPVVAGNWFATSLRGQRFRPPVACFQSRAVPLIPPRQPEELG